MKKITVNEENSGDRLDLFLTKYFKIASRNRIKELIKTGCVCVNNRPSRPSTVVGGGDLVEVRGTIDGNIGIRCQKDIDFSVLYYDEHIIVVDKPSGLVVHPGRHNQSGTLVNGVLYRFGVLPPEPAYTRPGIVHRLDKGTSGVMMIARTAKAYEFLKEQFKQQSVKKIYVALVRGVPRFTSDIIEKGIRPGISPFNYTRMEISSEGKHSVTEYTVEEEFDGFSFLTVKPKTGRTHQIRLHLASIGHAVLCDTLYGHEKIYSLHSENADEGGAEGAALNRLALHARELEFVHPVTGSRLLFSADIPEEFALLMDAARQMKGGIIPERAEKSQQKDR